jgi:shikimate 5-dehydrogenase
LTIFFISSEKAVTLANAVGGQALRLADLENFGPEEGMILANATSLGMYPNVDGTPVPKVTCKHNTCSIPAAIKF